MTQIRITYAGDLRCEAVHEQSGTQLLTDAPRDNQGLGQSFSPTDLVATALGTCMLTIMGIVAARHDLELGGATVQVDKQMTADPERRIGRLTVSLHLPAALDARQRSLLEQAAHTCPVHKSLHPNVEIAVSFQYDLAP